MNIICDEYLVEIRYPRKIDHQLWTTHTNIFTAVNGSRVAEFRTYGRSRSEASGSAYFLAKQKIMLLPTIGTGK